MTSVSLVRETLETEEGPVEVAYRRQTDRDWALVTDASGKVGWLVEASEASSHGVALAAGGKKERRWTFRLGSDTPEAEGLARALCRRLDLPRPLLLALGPIRPSPDTVHAVADALKRLQQTA